MKNPFIGSGLEATFANIIYNLLMTHQPVSYEMVYNEFMPRPKDYFKTHSISDEDGYGALKKAFPKIIKALKEKDEHSITDNGKKGKGRSYTYTGMEDPLAEERNAVTKSTLQDYIHFCKKSSGLFPLEWFSHFFENTQLLLESKRDREAGNVYIESGVKQILRGIERLPILYEHITKHHVLSFCYHPYTKDVETVIMHPHFLKEYNGRWFLMGWMDKNKSKQIVTNYALDRIESEPQVIESIEYVAAPSGFYKTFFNNMVGVSREKHSEGIQDVVIRSQSLYMHELVNSKKFHHSQKETKPFGVYEDGTYGEFTLHVEWNRELKGKILTFGQELLVTAPDSFVRSIQESVSVLWEHYKCQEMVPDKKEP